MVCDMVELIVSLKLALSSPCVLGCRGYPLEKRNRDIECKTTGRETRSILGRCGINESSGSFEAFVATCINNKEMRIQRGK